MQVGGRIIWRGFSLCGVTHRSHSTTFKRHRFTPRRHSIQSAHKFRMVSMAPEVPKWSAKEVRQTFLDYFKEKRQHTFGTEAHD
jgi:hypothetical protein